MTRRKANSSSVRFSWKRDPKFDLMLLQEVESKNPFAFSKPKAIWEDIAKCLKNSNPKMKVTDRSCRERTSDLLESFRKDEIQSSRASGVTEEDITEMDQLLINIAKLQDEKTKAPEIKELYSKRQRKEAEKIREEVLNNATDDSGDDDSLIIFNDGQDVPEANGGTTVSDDSSELTPKRARRNNPKKDLVSFLEKKTENEHSIRKDEIRIKEMEAENKRLELQILQQKTEAEIEERKRMTDLLIQLAGRH